VCDAGYLYGEIHASGFNLKGDSMGIEGVMIAKLQEKVYVLEEIIRIYLSVREDVGETGEEPFDELLTAYARKVWTEIHGEDQVFSQ